MRMKVILLYISVVLLCAGCRQKEAVQEQPDSENGVYQIYGVKDYDIVSSKYKTETTDSDLLVSEFLQQMKLSGEENRKEGGIFVESQSINNQVVYLSFNKEYAKLDTVREVLYRASVVKTIAQVPGISYVFFYVDGVSLTYADGSPVGKMAAADFVDETDDDLNALSWTKITLYFANATGDRLVKKDLDVAYSKTMSVEKLVIEQLISGPDRDDVGMKSTLPASLKVLGVSVKDTVCYLNLDGAFLNELVDASAMVQIYSIVNSLTQLPNISAVQIQVNGDIHNTLREISLDKTFAYNIDLIETEEEKKN